MSSPSIATKGACANCGHEELSVRPVTRSFGSGEQLLVIEGIPLVSCNHCGTSYFEARTLHEIARLRRDSTATKIVRNAPVAEFPGSLT